MASAIAVDYWPRAPGRFPLAAALLASLDESLAAGPLPPMDRWIELPTIERRINAVVKCVCHCIPIVEGMRASLIDRRGRGTKNRIGLAKVTG